MTGPPLAIGEAVATEAQFYLAAVSSSADGTLAVRPPPAMALINADMNAFNAELHLVDRSGAPDAWAARDSSPIPWRSTPYGRTLAAAMLDPRTGTQDLWLMDEEGHRRAADGVRGFAGVPVWSADGKRLAYSHQAAGQLDDIYIKEIATGFVPARDPNTEHARPPRGMVE